MTITFWPTPPHHGDFYYPSKSPDDFVVRCVWGDCGKPSVGMKYDIDRGWLPACEECGLASENAAPC